MVLDLSEKQIKVVHLQIWERGSGIDNMRQENFYCILCIILWQHLILRVLKGIWDWMPCTNTMWCPQPKHCNLFTEKNKQQEQQKGTSRVFDIIQTRSSGSQIICHTYDMTAVKAPGTQAERDPGVHQWQFSVRMHPPGYLQKSHSFSL